MKFNREAKVAIIFIAFAIFYLALSSQIDSKNLYASGGVSSKSLPLIYGIVMIIFSIALFITSMLKQKDLHSNDQDKKPVSTVYIFGHQIKRKPLYLALSIILFAFYAFTYTRLGFVLSGFIYLGCMIMLLTPTDKKSKKMLMFGWCFSFVFVLGLYLVFTKFLSMMLPRGILF
ncbi:MAG: tripartite tricarboxylate transporter TctB family protein [Spirochaetales bacterium]|nr:tripartite tricarboxylate transporter TctB family protein [Spirochaetales bacterium]